MMGWFGVSELSRTKLPASREPGFVGWRRGFGFDEVKMTHQRWWF